MAQKKTGTFNGWIGYTFGNVKYDFGALAPEPYPASHDKTHEAKIVGIYKFGAWNFASTLIYATGTPYTTPESRYYLPLLNGDEFNYSKYTSKRTRLEEIISNPDYPMNDKKINLPSFV